MGTYHHWRIELIDSEPPIWRTFQVPDHITLADLHGIVQLIMGWQNRHRYYFELADKIVGDRARLGTDNRYGSLDLPNTQDPNGLSLGSLNLEPGAKFTYLYDLQSGWLHRLTLTECLTPAQSAPHAIRCLDGALACPPEESGGVWGYEELMDRLADIDDPDYEALLNAIGLDFDPNYFKVDEVNQRLHAGLPSQP